MRRREAWMLFDRRTIDHLRRQTDILRVVKAYVKLRKSGANHVGLCPFHTEKTPSFKVHPGKQIFKCFGCGAAGDVFDFVMRIEGLRFTEAVERVAALCGIPSPQKYNAPENVPQPEKEEHVRLRQICARAARFFQDQLNRPENHAARAFLAGHGIAADTGAAMGLGYAPGWRDGLTTFLRAHGAALADLVRAGLTVETADGRHHDRFRDRIIIPIADTQGRVVAFLGRAMSDDKPQDAIPPETPIHRPDSHLFGLDKTKGFIRQAGFAVIVHGWLNFVRIFQDGVRNVVGLLEPTVSHLQMRRLRCCMTTPKVILHVPENPGVAETWRRIGLFLLAHGFRVNLLTLPEEPAGFIDQYGGDAYRRRLTESQPALERWLAESAAAETEQHIEILNAVVLPYLANIEHAVERELLAERLADQMRISHPELRCEMRRAARQRRPQLNQDAVELITELPPTEETILHILSAHPSLCETAFARIDAETMEHLKGKTFFRAMRELMETGTAFTSENLRRAVARRHAHDTTAAEETPGVRQVLSRLLTNLTRCTTPTPPATVRAVLEEALDTLQRRKLESNTALLRRTTRPTVTDQDENDAMMYAAEKLRLKRAQLAARRREPENQS